MARSRIGLWRALGPLPATAVGVAIAEAHDVSWVAYAPNLVALVLGVALVVVVPRIAGDRLAAWAPGLAALGILATLVGPGIDGVHRWISLGALRLGVSALLAPWILLGLAAGQGRARGHAILAALVAQVVHVVQPDAGQATALAAGALPLLLDRMRAPTPVGVASALALALLAAAAWLRDDPLAAVDHVERILVLGASEGAPWVVAMVAVGAALVACIVVPGRGRVPGVVVVGLASYCVATFVVTFFGCFPVPILGAGASPVIGWYSLLAVRASAEPRPSAEA